MIEVNIGACTCPGTPHPDGDVVFLREKMGLAGGSILTSIAKEYLGVPLAERDIRFGDRLIADLRVAYVQTGVVAWNLQGPEGDLPLTGETLQEQLVDDYNRGMAVSEKADDLYYEAVLGPLLGTASKPSRSTPTKKRTSATKSSAPKSTTPTSQKARSRLRSIPGSQPPPSTSKPSSTTTSQTAYIETTSIGRVSASSS